MMNDFLIAMSVFARCRITFIIINSHIDFLSPEQNDLHFGGMCKWMFLKENVPNLIDIAPKFFFAMGTIDNKSTLV